MDKFMTPVIHSVYIHYKHLWATSNAGAVMCTCNKCAHQQKG